MAAAVCLSSCLASTARAGTIDLTVSMDSGIAVRIVDHDIALGGVLECLPSYPDPALAARTAPVDAPTVGENDCELDREGTAAWVSAATAAAESLAAAAQSCTDEADAIAAEIVAYARANPPPEDLTTYTILCPFGTIGAPSFYSSWPDLGGSGCPTACTSQLEDSHSAWEVATREYDVCLEALQELRDLENDVQCGSGTRPCLEETATELATRARRAADAVQDATDEVLGAGTACAEDALPTLAECVECGGTTVDLGPGVRDALTAPIGRITGPAIGVLTSTASDGTTDPGTAGVLLDAAALLRDTEVTTQIVFATTPEQQSATLFQDGTGGAVVVVGLAVAAYDSIGKGAQTLSWRDAASAYHALDTALDGTMPPVGRNDQPTVDTSVGALALGGASEQILAQVITPSIGGTLVDTALPVSCDAASDPTYQADLQIQIRTVADGQPGGDDDVIATWVFDGGPLVGAQDPPNPDSPTWPEFVHFPLNGGPEVTAESPFALVLTSVGGTDANGTVYSQCAIFQGPKDDPYPYGDLFFDARPNAPGVWVPDFDGRDLPFEVAIQVPLTDAP